MINAIQFALNGLTGAARKADTAAQDIARNGGDADYATDAVNLIQAKVESKANAGVINTVDDMEKDLLHMFDEKV